MNELLSVKQLRIAFKQNPQAIEATEVVKGIDFSLKAGKTLALVGESGSGKSVTAMSLMRLLPAFLTEVSAKQCLFQDHATGQSIELFQQSDKAWQRLRGGRIAMIFQDPLSALNPIMRVGKQLAEVLQLHMPTLAKSDYPKYLSEALQEVGIDDAEEKLRAYPHQLSGGQRQRVMIAMALLAKPQLLIADEPTTALDVTVEVQIIALLKALKAKHKMGMLFISHDLAVVSAIADEIAVMQAGKLVEIAPTQTLLTAPKHPYTQQLLAASRFIHG